MPRFSQNQSAWIAILGIALLLRLGTGMWWQARLGPGQFFFGDSAGYWELGRTIARGEPYEYLSPDNRVFRTPGYPLVLASLFLLLGDDPPVMAARALSAVLGTVAVGIAGWWSCQLFDGRAGRIAGVLAAVYPGSIALGVFVLSEAPFCPLMLAHLGCWSQACRSASSGRAIGWGAAGGAMACAATMMRPSWLLFAPFALLVGLPLVENRKRHLLIGSVMCATLAVGMLPWWIRNARVTGRFVATSLQVGASLYDGLHPGATGASDMRFVPEVAARERAAPVPAAESDTFEYRLDRRMFQESVVWARAHPGRVMELVWVKFWRMWNVWPNEPAFRGWMLRTAVLVTYLPLLILGLVGACRYSNWGWSYALAWLPAVYLTGLHVIFVSSIRYREPAMLALVVLAAGVLAGFARRRTAPQTAAATS